MKPRFDHEKLHVYQAALRFNAWAGRLIDAIDARAALKDQLDRAATSIALNIAEGNGKFSRKDRARYFDIARGSAVESAACLDVAVSRELATLAHVDEGKVVLIEIVSMLMGLLKNLGYFGDVESSRVREEIGSADFEGEMVPQVVTYASMSKSKRKK